MLFFFDATSVSGKVPLSLKLWIWARAASRLARVAFGPARFNASTNRAALAHEEFENWSIGKDEKSFFIHWSNRAISGTLGASSPRNCACTTGIHWPSTTWGPPASEM